MKQLFIAFLMLSLFSTAAMGDTYFGIYADAEGTVCNIDVELASPVTLYIIAHLDETIPVLRAAEFRIDNAVNSLDTSKGMATYHWNTNLVITHFVDHSVALSFPTPLTGPVAILGTIDIIAFQPDYINDYLVMNIMPTIDYGYRQVVDGNYDLHNVGTSRFTFNCTNLDLCECMENVAAKEVSWSSIKALY
ncbi:MAG: hypothetical protein GY835_20440 [bacterium]|nr:hypothetical protein [bacterium]